MACGGAAPPGVSSCVPPPPSLSSRVVGSNAKLALLGLRFFFLSALWRSDGGGGGGGGGHEHLFSLSSTREWEDLSGRPQTCVESVREVVGSGVGGSGPPAAGT